MNRFQAANVPKTPYPTTAIRTGPGATSIRGAFPGGPSRAAEAPVRDRPPRLRRVGDIEEALAERRIRHSRRMRFRRLVWGVLGSVAAAAGIGFGLGLGSHRTPEEVKQDQAVEARKQLDMELSKEVNRTLLELWKMEDVEYLRNH